MGIYSALFLPTTVGHAQIAQIAIIDLKALVVEWKERDMMGFFEGTDQQDLVNDGKV